MNRRLDEILEEIRELEKALQAEMARREQDFRYKLRERRVIFEEGVVKLHRKLASSLFFYIITASPRAILSAPFIYAMIIPALLMDLGLWIYQSVCFTLYGIPKVKRGDHIVLDRHYLKYLNALERLNCDYCSYFNGLSSYAMEIAARTEQYWCPIKHASGKALRHSMAHLFTDYGDAEAYRTKLDEIRRQLNETE